MTDDDVLVLKQLRDAFGRYLRLPAQASHTLLVPDVPGLTPDAVLGICGKVQSLGLVATAEQHAKALKRGAYPPGGGYAPLDRAEAFLRFIADMDRKPRTFFDSHASINARQFRMFAFVCTRLDGLPEVIET